MTTPAETARSTPGASPLALPDSDVAVAAMRHVEMRVPPWVVAHSIRSYLWSREIAGQQGLQAGLDYDDELLFLADLLHDLGVSTLERGPQRFEVDGADQAVAFARSAGLATEKLAVLWDAIALHTSAGIAERKQPEVAVAHLGISADIVGNARERLPADLVAAVHKRYPRDDLGYRLTDLIVQHVRREPTKAPPLSFPGHLLDLDGPVGRSRTWFDALAATGWGDRPVGEVASRGAADPGQLAEEFTRRLAGRDVEGLVALYDPDAILVTGPGTIARGHDQIRAAFSAMTGATFTIELTPHASHITADQALVANTATMRSADTGETRTTTTTEVSRRRPDGRWVYLIDDPFFGGPTDAEASPAPGPARTRSDT